MNLLIIGQTYTGADAAPHSNFVEVGEGFTTLGFLLACFQDCSVW